MRTRRAARLLVGGIVLIVLGALVHTWIHLRALELGYAIAEESRLLDDLRQVERRLRVEVSYLKRPARIEAEAKRLGMRTPDTDKVFPIRVSDDATDDDREGRR